MEFEYKIGLRVIKSVIAVFLCFLVKFIFGSSTVFYDSITALLCIQPTAEQSLKFGLNRLLGTFTGSVIGFIVLEAAKFIPFYKEFLYVFIIPLGMLLAMYICIFFKKERSVAICSIVYLCLVTSFESSIQNTEQYVFIRLIDTTLGVIIGTLVNKYFFVRKNKEI
jgi:Predicted membrane protein